LEAITRVTRGSSSLAATTTEGAHRGFSRKGPDAADAARLGGASMGQHITFANSFRDATP
jgi:hypothetical protein